MPLLQTITTEEYSLAIWLMSETEEEWAAMLKKAKPGFLIPPHLNREKQIREFSAVRMLLYTLLGEIPEISHSPEGKPMMPNDDRHISLSHSEALAAVIISPFPAGIDTEMTTRKVEQIATRFLSESELEWTARCQNRREALVFCWSTKETVFKMINQPGTQFKTMISIPGVDLKNQKNTAVSFIKNGITHQASLNFLFSGNNVVTWSVYSQGFRTTQSNNSLT